MMSRIKITFIALSIIYCIRESRGNFWKEYIEPTSAILSIDTSFTESCAERRAPGFVCLDCTVLARCVYRGNQWDTIAVEACDAGQRLYCNPADQRCSSNMGPCHPGNSIGDPSFSCSSSGVFPDPYSCQAYHLCFPSGPQIVSMNIRCGSNSAFNPVTNDCSLPTSHQVCQGSPFKCDEVGQMGAWPMNANIYYICMARSVNSNRMLFPQIFRCPMGMVFHNDDCVTNPGINQNNRNFACQRPGLFPDLGNCRAYFFCDGNLRSQNIMCPVGTYFNRMIYGCVRGNCV